MYMQLQLFCVCNVIHALVQDARHMDIHNTHKIMLKTSSIVRAIFMYTILNMIVYITVCVYRGTLLTTE